MTILARRLPLITTLSLIALAGAPAPSGAQTAGAPPTQQSLAQRLRAVREGTVVLRYATRPGVCGDGRSSFSFGGSMRVGEYNVRGDGGRDAPCLPGPARARLRLQDGGVREVRVTVGAAPERDGEAPVVDLGTVPAAAAAELFLHLAATEAGQGGRHAIAAAVLADSASVWRPLLAIARDLSARPRGTRRESMFWLALFAAARMDGRGEDLSTPDDDDRDDARTAAVFALSQLRDGEGIDPLVQVVRTTKDARIRRKALFWLGQSDDPRALSLVGEILTRP